MQHIASLLKVFLHRDSDRCSANLTKINTSFRFEINVLVAIYYILILIQLKVESKIESACNMTRQHKRAKKRAQMNVLMVR